MPKQKTTEWHEPVKDPRAVVSVGIGAEDFALIAEAARKSGKKLSAFIRDAAIQAATPAKPLIVYGSGSVTCSGNGRIEVWQ